MRSTNSVITALIIMVVLPTVLMADKMLTFEKRGSVGDDDGYRPRGFYSGRSRLNLLGLERESPFAFPKAAGVAGVVDTINILALRVDFRYEDPDDANTTGRGVFDLRDTAAFLADEGHAIDPAPHNKTYFEAHLRALARYWNVVSNGRLRLEYEVWPQATDSAYHLDSSMAYYGLQPPNFGLGQFFHDALGRAYEIDGGSFSFRDNSNRKKAVMIFHAGADQQTNLWFSETDTPYDLYTGFAVFDSLNWVELGGDTISEGIIMPETMTQDNRVTVMNAVMAHEFGHQLGLVDLYNTGSSPFLTQTGDFSLMDNIGMNTAVIFDDYGVGVFGTVPVYPCAWSRAFLGFEEVVEFREGTSIPLAAAKMLTDWTQIVRIPISSTEYYLLENRRGDVDGEVEGIQFDSTTNVMLGPVKRDPSSGQLIPLREYDLNLPEGSAGIAAWHIDERVAAADYFPFDVFGNNFEANTLQWDRARRFVRLVEADGNIDFGGNYHRGYGRPEDLFYEGNNSTLAAYTNPPSISNDGGYTHIKISNISAPSMIMSFDVTREKSPALFPRRISIPTEPGLSPVAADLDRDGDDEIIAVSGRRILAVYADGRDFLDSLGESDDFDTVFSPITVTTDVNNTRPIDTGLVPMPIFAETEDEISAGPVVVELSDTMLVLVGTKLGREYVFYTTPDTPTNPYRADRWWLKWETFHSVTGIAVDIQNEVIHFLHGDGGIYSQRWSNHETRLADSIVGVCRINDGMAVLCELPGGSVLYRLRDISIFEIDNRDTVVADSIFIAGETGFHPPIATDFDRDGTDDVVLLSRSGHILCFSFTDDGIEKYDDLDIYTGDTAAAGPVAGDFSGNGFPELIVPGTNTLYGFDRHGYTALDFPITVDKGRSGQLLISTPIISDVDGNGTPDIAVAALDSTTYSKSATIFYLDTLTSPDTTYLRTRDTSYTYYNYSCNTYVVSPGVFRIEGFPVPVGAVGVRSLADTIVGVGAPLHVKVGTNGYLVTSGADGWLNAWNCGWSDDAAYWPMAGRSHQGTNYLPLEGIGEEKALAEFFPEKRFFGYPNPATGNKATIHYYVNKSASVTVSIFDALGDKVAEMHKEVVDGNGEDEIVWDLSAVASGVYHCRIEAIALNSDEQVVAFKSIAVVK